MPENIKVPKVFISYSHDTQEHKKWVLDLATRLRNNGIDAILDQFELKPGDDLPHFMETHLASSDRVLMICTDNYVSKANAGQGGVGYEKMIVTSDLLGTIDESKVIPIIRQTGTSNVPTFLKTKKYINFSKDDEFEFGYDELVRAIHNSPLFKKPPIGNNPFKNVDESVEANALPKHAELVYQYALDQYNRFGYNTWVSDLIKQKSISRIMAEHAIKILVERGLAESAIAGGDIRMELTDKGKFYALELGLVK